MSKVWFVLSLLVSLWIVAPGMAQETPPPDTCPAFSVDALEAIATECTNLDTGSVCYGAGDITILPDDTDSADEFSSPGDTLNITDLERLVLSSPDADSETDTGITPPLAIIHVESNTIDTESNQIIEMVLYGDITLTTDDGTPGAFAFQHLPEAAVCEDSPAGLLLQTAGNDSDTPAEITINGIALSFDGTLFLTARPSEDMQIMTLAGSADVTAADETEVLNSGEIVTVRINDNLRPLAPPATPQTILYDDNPPVLPVTFTIANILLPDEIEVPDELVQADTPSGSGGGGAETGTDSTGTADTIQPESGVWVIDQTSTESGACPFGDTSGSITYTETLTFEESFSWEQLYPPDVAARIQPVPPSSVSNPEPNVYVYEWPASVQTITILSPTEILSEDIGRDDISCKRERITRYTFEGE